MPFQGSARTANQKPINPNPQSSLRKGGIASSGSSKNGTLELNSSSKHPKGQFGTSSSDPAAVPTTAKPANSSSRDDNTRQSSSSPKSELQPLFQLALLSEVMSDSEGLMLSRALKAAPPIHIGPPSYSTSSSSMRRPWGAVPRCLVDDVLQQQGAGNKQPVTDAIITAAIAAARNCEDVGALSRSGLSGRGPGKSYQKQDLVAAFARGTVDGGVVMQAVARKLQEFMLTSQQLELGAAGEVGGSSSQHQEPGLHNNMSLGRAALQVLSNHIFVAYTPIALCYGPCMHANISCKPLLEV